MTTTPPIMVVDRLVAMLQADPANLPSVVAAVVWLLATDSVQPRLREGAAVCTAQPPFL